MGVMPSYAFFIRHASNVELNNIDVQYLGNESRPAFYVEDVQKFSLRKVNAQPVKNTPLMVLQNISQLSVKDCEGLKDQVLQNVATKKL